MKNIDQEAKKEYWYKRRIVIFGKQVPTIIVYSILALFILVFFLPKLIAGIALFGIIHYILFACPLQILAQKTNTKPIWLAWIPIANFYLMCKIAKIPLLLFIGLFIPIIHLIAWYLVGAGLAESRNSPRSLGLLMLIPGFGQVILLWHLALKK